MRLVFLVLTLAITITSCAYGHRNSRPTYPDFYSTVKPVWAFLGQVTSIDYALVTIQVVEPIYGECPSTVWFHNSAYFHLNATGCPTDRTRSGPWFSIGDHVVAIFSPPTLTGRYGKISGLGYIRWFDGAFADTSQVVKRQVGADDWAALHICDDRDSVSVQELYASIERSWAGEDMTLGQLSTDIRDFYEHRRRWRLVHGSPWHRTPKGGRWQLDP